MAINNQPTIKPRTVCGLFTKFIPKVIPLAFDESMSYYECLCALLDYINKNVIPALDNNAEGLLELQEFYEELQSYVNNYFDNLDVQEEINNKLDQMVEDGVLEQIIEQFLQLTSLICFDNVAAMKVSPNLANGSYAKTLGYYAANDNGGATYKIRAVTNEDVIDEMFIIALSNNTLVAELIINDVLCVNQIGCKGDGLFDNSTILNNLLSHKYVKNITFVGGQEYYCANPIVITKEFKINGNFAKLISGSNAKAFSININNEDDSTVHEAYAGTIEQLIFEGESSTILFENTNGYKGTIKNCYFHKFYGIGLQHINGYEMLYENLRFWGEGTNSTGIRSANNDIHFNNIFMCNCHVGMKLQGSANFINNFHAWIFSSDNYADSKCIEITGNGVNFLSQIYIDSYNYGFFYSGYGHIHANEVMCLFSNGLSSSLDPATTCFMDYNTSDIANYDWQSTIEDIYLVGTNEYTKFSNTSVENIHANIYITQSGDASYFDYNNRYYDLTFPSNVTVRKKEITRDKQNVHLKLVVTIANATTGYNTIGTFKHSTVPLHTINFATPCSTSEYMNAPYLQMVYMSATNIQVSFDNAGTQTVYLDVTYLAKNDKRNQ